MPSAFKTFKQGVKWGRKKEWQCCQLQTRLAFKTNNDVKAKEFSNPEEALKFRQHLIQNGYKKDNIFVHKEVISFMGAVCNTPRTLDIVYFSDKKLTLTPEQHGFGHELKELYSVLKPHTKKPTKEEMEEFREVLPVKARKYSEKPVCEV